MNLIYDDWEQIHQLEWNLTHSVPNRDVDHLEIRLMDLFEEEVILRPFYLWQAVTVTI